MVTERENFKKLEISFDEILIEIIYIAVFFKNTTWQRFPFCLWQCKKEYMKM